MVTEEQKIRYKELLTGQKAIHKVVGKSVKRCLLVSILIGFVIGLSSVGVGIVMDQSEIKGFDFDAFVIKIYIALLIFSLAYILHIILHEAGHLVFGLLTGYKFLSFRIFSTIFYKKDGKINRRKFSIKGTAGQCLMYPPLRRPDGSFPFVLYNLGGGINNLIFSLPLVIPILLVKNTNARIVFSMLLLAGILTAATNIIPMSIGIQNDGMNIKSMLKDKCMQEAFYLQLKVNAEMSNGKKITDYSPEEFTLPEGANDTNMLTAAVRIYSYYQLLSTHDFEAAEQALSVMEEKALQYQMAVWNMIEAERLFFMVLRHRPIEEIASVYKHSRLVLTAAKTQIEIQRVRYIYEAFMTEEEKKDIMALITKKAPRKWKECDQEKSYQKILKVAKNYPVIGEADMNMDIVEYIREHRETFTQG
ncbi:MAG TPA: hypothetical protein VJZ06_01935 [Mobilitalea sp.]|nr:hypothetical protein [Mobilitalea sp.]